MIARTPKRELKTDRHMPVTSTSAASVPAQNSKVCMKAKSKALSVHLLTASGAVFAMLAMLAAVNETWNHMFFWLVIALVVDGIDGPLARRYNVTTHFPIFDGALLDLIIDYLTYVFVPAYALFQSGVMEGWTAWVAIVSITFGSALYFADTRMKTTDKSFQGFPGCWNMVVLVLFALTPPSWVSLAVVLILSVGMFAPLKFIHPTRTRRWRNISLPVTMLWIICAAWAALTNFDLGPLAQVCLLGSTAYLMLAGIAQQIFPEKKY